LPLYSGYAPGVNDSRRFDCNDGMGALRMARLLILILVVGLAWHFLLRDDAVVLGPGVMAAEAPWQESISDAKPFMLDDYRVTPLAEFSLRAKLLAREAYSLGEESDLSPVDFALGWGPMSDEAVVQNIEISQSGRWYRWRAHDNSLKLRDISLHSSNMHIIPADDAVADLIDDVRVGQIVDLDGYLVRVDGADGWRWISSLSREDTGAGACELFYVKRVQTVF